MQMVGVVALVILLVVSAVYLSHHIGERIKKDRNLREKMQAFAEKMLEIETAWAFGEINGKFHEKMNSEDKKKFQEEWNKIWREYRELDFVTPTTEKIVHETERKTKFFFSTFFEKSA